MAMAAVAGATHRRGSRALFVPSGTIQPFVELHPAVPAAMLGLRLAATRTHHRAPLTRLAAQTIMRGGRWTPNGPWAPCWGHFARMA